jgi:hypothetical protein
MNPFENAGDGQKGGPIKPPKTKEGMRILQTVHQILNATIIDEDDVLQVRLISPKI